MNVSSEARLGIKRRLQSVKSYGHHAERAEVGHGESIALRDSSRMLTACTTSWCAPQAVWLAVVDDEYVHRWDVTINHDQLSLRRPTAQLNGSATSKAVYRLHHQRAPPVFAH